MAIKAQKSYELILVNDRRIRVLKRSLGEKYYIDPDCLDSAAKEEFVGCLELDSMPMNSLCLKVEKIFKSKIQNIL